MPVVYPGERAKRLRADAGLLVGSQLDSNPVREPVDHLD